jgi:hypothetical protein
MELSLRGIVIPPRTSQRGKIMAKTASSSYEQPAENVSGKKTLPATKARAGLKDKDTLYMMIVGTMLTILLFGAIFLFYWRV